MRSSSIARRGIEQTSNKEFFFWTVASCKIRREFPMQQFIPHSGQQASISPEAKPAYNLFALVSHEVLQFLFINSTDRVM